jgi:exonuclease SbcD
MQAFPALRVAHFSDLHFGSKTLAEAQRCFAFAVGESIRRGVDCAVLTGDASDHALEAHAPAYEALICQVRRLADHCPVLILQGTYSHEPPGTLNVFRHLGGRYAVHVADRIGHVALTRAGAWQPAQGIYFDAAPADVMAVFSCVPTMNKAAVASWAGASAAPVESSDLVARLLSGFGPGNELARTVGIPTIGVAHGTVNGCITEHGVPMASLDHEFTTAVLFEAACTAFLLGHIHRHQSWRRGGRVIAYAGSIGRFHFGEQGDKGFLLWRIGAHEADFELVGTPARRTIEVDFDGPPDLERLRSIADDVAGASVRVRWTVPEEARDTVDRAAILHALQAAAEVKLEGMVASTARVRAAGITSCGTLAEKLQRWAHSVNVPAEPLLQRLQLLESRTPEQIATAILNLTEGEADAPSAPTAARAFEDAS